MQYSPSRRPEHRNILYVDCPQSASRRDLHGLFDAVASGDDPRLGQKCTGANLDEARELARRPDSGHVLEVRSRACLSTSNNRRIVACFRGHVRHYNSAQLSANNSAPGHYYTSLHFSSITTQQRRRSTHCRAFPVTILSYCQYCVNIVNNE